MMRLAIAAAAALATLPAGAAGLDRNPELAGWMEHALERSMAGSYVQFPLPDAARYMTEDGVRRQVEAVERSGNASFMRQNDAVWSTDVSGLHVVSDSVSEGVRSVQVEGHAESVFETGDSKYRQALTINATFVQPASAEGRDGMLIRNIVAN